MIAARWGLNRIAAAAGFGATLLDLEARGWFRLTPPDPAAGSPGRGPLRQAGGRGPAGPVMCVVPAEAPAQQLTPYERRVVVQGGGRSPSSPDQYHLAIDDGVRAKAWDRSGRGVGSPRPRGSRSGRDDRRGAGVGPGRVTNVVRDN